MNTDAAHKSNWAIGEVVFGIPFLAGLALHFVFPLSFLPRISRQIFIPVGIISIIAGIGLIVSARREFARYRQPTDPGQPTSQIIKTGVFSISRNPLYLAAVLVFLGLALSLNNAWVLAALLVSVILCVYILIIPEERYLTAKFGAEYKDYMATVHRWLGRKPNA